jgi:hypothetical protein
MRQCFFGYLDLATVLLSSASCFRLGGGGGMQPGPVHLIDATLTHAFFGSQLRSVDSGTTTVRTQVHHF